MKSVDTNQVVRDDSSAPARRGTPLTVVIRPNFRLDIPTVVARAAEVQNGGFVEVTVVAINQEIIIPPPHAFVAQVQQTNYFLTVPRLNARILGLHPGDVVDCYIRSV